jgi:hypothetical protein
MVMNVHHRPSIADNVIEPVRVSSVADQIQNRMNFLRVKMERMSAIPVSQRVKVAMSYVDRQKAMHPMKLRSTGTHRWFSVWWL